MAYRIRYTQTAIDELHTANNWIAERVPEVAEAWFDGFILQLEKLHNQPLLYGLAPESELLEIDVRQITYRTKSRLANRALFTVRGNEVIILGIRRPGQQLLSPQEVEKRLTE